MESEELPTVPNIQTGDVYRSLEGGARR